MVAFRGSAEYRKHGNVSCIKRRKRMEIKTEYRRDLQHTWLIISGGSIPEEDAYTVRMLTENRISGLLPCKTVSLDGEMRFYYDISSRHTFSTILETESVNRQLLKRLFISLAKVMEHLSEYLLDPDGLLLDPAYMYCVPDKPEICFCWYPGADMPFNGQAKQLGSALLPLLEQADRAGVVIGYRFYQYCEAEELTVDVLHGLLRQKAEEKKSRPVTKEEIERAAVLDAFFEEPEEEETGIRSFGKRVKDWFSRKRKKQENKEAGYTAEFRDQKDRGASGGLCESPLLVKEPENIYLREAGSKLSAQVYEETETMLLTPDMLTIPEKKNWILQIRENQGREREILLTKELYLIGKTGSGAALQLASPAVSRLHAKLEKDGENWCLSDLNSKNSTRLIRDSGRQQEILLQPGETAVLQEGDVIWFADVMCRVKQQAWQMACPAAQLDDAEEPKRRYTADNSNIGPYSGQRTFG